MAHATAAAVLVVENFVREAKSQPQISWTPLVRPALLGRSKLLAILEILAILGASRSDALPSEMKGVHPE